MGGGGAGPREANPTEGGGGGWDEVWVGEIGGYAVAWSTLSGRILRGLTEFGPAWLRRITGTLLGPASFVVNGVGAVLARLERSWHAGPFVLPMGLILVARRPPS